jgi:hypothetical protein
MKDGKDNLSHPIEQEDEALWQLLGRAKAPTVSPYFSRRVLREVATLEEKRGLTAMLARFWQRTLDATLRMPRATYSGGALAAALVCAISVALLPHDGATPGQMRVARVASDIQMTQTDSTEELTAQDVDVIADLDTLLAYDENTLWTEDTTN